MKKILTQKEYGYGEFNNIEKDVGDSINKLDTVDFTLGRIRVTITHLSEDDCDCTGFQHNQNCPHHVMCY